jgi:hypothetical protein
MPRAGSSAPDCRVSRPEQTLRDSERHQHSKAQVVPQVSGFSLVTTSTLGNMNIKKAVAYLKRIVPGEGKLIADIPADDQPFHLPFSSEIAIFFLVDTGDHYAMVQNRHFQEQQLSPCELLERAISNLDIVRRSEIEVRSHHGILTFEGNGNLEASLLLIPELWDIGLASFCPNGFIAAIPARDALAVCDRNDLESIKGLRQFIESAWSGSDHLLSKSLYVREEGKWVPHPGA